MTTISTKPYMLRAIFEWCVDNGFTPYIVVMADAYTKVPAQFVRDGQIVLNISYEATSGLQIDNELISFKARFGGVSRDISIPVDNVLAIYANENGQGMMFDPPAPAREGEKASAEAEPTGGNEPEPPKKGGPPTLTRVK